MPESAEEVYARIAAEDTLPAPDIIEWDVFPWTVRDGQIAPKPLAPPAPERAREGEDGKDCPLCAADLPGVIWQDDRWRVKHLKQSGLPLVLTLEPIEHVDLAALDDESAAELGVLSVRLARIIEAMDHIGRCHVSRWGDGSAHLHVWFLARTEGLPSTRGSFAAEWDDIVPPGPEEIWRADLAHVARKLATHGGRAEIS